MKKTTPHTEHHHACFVKNQTEQMTKFSTSTMKPIVYGLTLYKMAKLYTGQK